MAWWHIFFLGALLWNFGILLTNKFFSDNTLAMTHPGTFSTFGQWLVLVWGIAFYLAYLSVRHHSTPPWIMLAFVLEKMSYVVDAFFWWRVNTVAVDSPVAFFMKFYALGDFCFGIGFLLYFLSFVF